jgi:hypothetical protein
MDRHKWNLTDLTIALHRRFYLAIILDRYEELHTTITIALHKDFYLPIIMDFMNGPTLPLL